MTRFHLATLFGATLAGAQNDETGLLQSGTGEKWGWFDDLVDHFTPPAPPPPPQNQYFQTGDVGACDETLKGWREDGYRGCQDHTIHGTKCQMWTSQSPHGHSRTHPNYPDKGLGYHNFCRNPDGEPNIWCYTNSNTRWDYCKPRVTTCDETYKHDVNLKHWETGLVHVGNGAGYRGCKDVTHTGRRCQKWTDDSPHEHGRTPLQYPGFGLGYHNYCRNPDGEPAIWCYTEDPAQRWDFCDHCDNGYSGDDCSIPPACSSAEHCNGHVTMDMDKTNGCDCQCADGWSGSDCTVPPICTAAKHCHSHGYTSDSDSTDGCICSCTDGFSGSACATPPPCHARQHCSAHGTTGDHDATDGCLCSCSDDYRGDDCSIPPACSSDKHCNGHATLDTDSTDGCVCHCDHGWSGDDCKIPPACDAATDCSGHGTTTDKDKTDGCMCTCTGGFDGKDCSVEPQKMCCQAMTADCLACKADLTAAEFCAQNPKINGCAQHLPPPPKKPCCQSMEIACLSCQADLTESAYCKLYPNVEGCGDEVEVPC